MLIVFHANSGNAKEPEYCIMSVLPVLCVISVVDVRSMLCFMTP